MPIVPSKLLGGHRTLNQHRRMFESDPQRHRANFCCDAQCGTRPGNLTTGITQRVCSRSSTKVMVSGWPARVFPSASVNGKEAHRLSVCTTAMRYDERCVSDASLDCKTILGCSNSSPLRLKLMSTVICMPGRDCSIGGGTQHASNAASRSVSALIVACGL